MSHVNSYSDSRTRTRSARSKFIYGLVIVLSVLTCIPLFAIILQLIIKGYRQLNISLITEVAPTSLEAMFAIQNGDVIPGGILNGIVGTALMLLIAMVIAIPIGILCGIYLAEKGSSRLAGLIRDLTDILQGIPSIVIGIVVYLWVVKTMSSFSALAGGISLAIMMLPMIIRTTEESVKMIPNSLKEAGMALGGSYTSVLFRVILPSAFGGLFTGILLAISRVAGETAPLMVTALGATQVQLDITKPSSAISLLIWEFYNDPNLANLVWSSSLLLLIFILGLNLLSKHIAKKWKVE